MNLPQTFNLEPLSEPISDLDVSASDDDVASLDHPLDQGPDQMLRNPDELRHSLSIESLKDLQIEEDHIDQSCILWAAGTLTPEMEPNNTGLAPINVQSNSESDVSPSNSSEDDTPTLVHLEDMAEIRSQSDGG